MTDTSNAGATHRPRKRFGQNFLIDTSVIQRIVDAVSPKENELVVEIGPGQAALTKPLLNRSRKLTVVELDRDLATGLVQLQTQAADEGMVLTIHQADALKFDFSSLLNDEQRELRIVGNLPYNISSPLLFHLLPLGEVISDMHFMLQKEVVDRLAAEPGSKTYGRLSVMVQARCEVEALFEVPPEAFNPAPSVTSAVVRLNPKTLTQPVQDSMDDLEIVVRAAFAQRRKTLRNCLRGVIEADQLEALGVNPVARPETLSVETFQTIAEFIAHR